MSPLGAAGEIAPFDRPVLHDEGKRNREHCEIGPAHTQRRKCQQETDGTGDHAREREREPEVDALEREDGGGVGADRVEADMPERDLAGQADQDIEPDPDHGAERHQREHERRVTFGLGREEQAGGGQRDDGERHGLPGGRDPHDHTLFTAARPSRPLGMTASARMTTVNTTIWV
jgi:hypothetical protein